MILNPTPDGFTFLDPAGPFGGITMTVTGREVTYAPGSTPPADLGVVPETGVIESITLVYGEGTPDEWGWSYTGLDLTVEQLNALDADWATNPSGGTFANELPLINPGLTVELLGDLVSFLATDNGETIVGNSENNSLDGEGGDDTLIGKGGNDRLQGGPGNDRLFGDEGNDVLYGGSDDDFIDGGNGSDRIIGDSGNDRLIGWAGQDDIAGGADHDYAAGGAGNDVIDGDAGNDRLVGGAGDDVIDGGEGNDRIRGDDGDDDLSGGAGDDRVEGGEGDDYMTGDFGNDVVLGGDGNDILTSFSFVRVTGAGQNDDILRGDDGNDDILSLSGGDLLIGGDGDDILVAVDSNGVVLRDILIGGAGADIFYFVSDEPHEGDAVVKDFEVDEDILVTEQALDTTAQEQFDIFLAGATQQGNHIIYTDPLGGFKMTVQNVDIDELTVDNFIFVEGNAAPDAG